MASIKNVPKEHIVLECASKTMCGRIAKLPLFINRVQHICDYISLSYGLCVQCERVRDKARSKYSGK